MIAKPFKKMMIRFCKIVGIEVTEKLIDSCSFLESVWQNNRFAIVALACGFGKSVYSCIKAALDATEENPIAILLEMREDAENKYHILDALCPGKVGHRAGWSIHNCVHPRKEFIKDYENKRKVLCSDCANKLACLYYKSANAHKKAIYVATKDAFIYDLKAHPERFKNTSVIIDEDIQNLAKAVFTAQELSCLGYHMKILGISTLFDEAFPMVGFDAAGNIIFKPEANDAAINSMVRLQRSLGYLEKDFYSKGLALPVNEEKNSTIAKFISFFKCRDYDAPSYAAIVDNGSLTLLRKKIELKALPVKKVMVLDATANYSQNQFALDTMICDCPELLEKYPLPLAKFYIAIGNPTQSRRNPHSIYLEHMGLPDNLPLDIMIAENHNGKCFTKAAEDTLRRKANINSILPISRGKLRGTNEACHATVAILSTAGIFEGVRSTMLKAALFYDHTIKADEVFAPDGKLLMYKGAFSSIKMQHIYTCNCVSTIYQGLYRTALRRGREITAMIAIPNAAWLRELSKLMRFEVCGVFGDPVTGRRIKGLAELLQLPDGHKMTKQTAAAALGYAGYKRNKRVILSYLAEGFIIKRKCIMRMRKYSTAAATKGYLSNKNNLYYNGTLSK